MKHLLAIAILAPACGAVEDDYDYTDTHGLTITWSPGQRASESVIGANEWNCGLRALALLRDGLGGEWDASAWNDAISDNLPARRAGAHEGMSTVEVAMAAQMLKLRAQVNQVTAFEDLYELPAQGRAAVVLTRDGTYREDLGIEHARFHWVPLVGSAVDEAGNQYLIVVPKPDGERKALPRADFRKLVWWDAGGLTEGAMQGAGTRPGTSIEIWR